MKKLMAILALIPFLGFGGQLDYTTAEVNTILGQAITNTADITALEGDVDTVIGDITKSYVVVTGTSADGTYPYEEMYYSRPYYGDSGDPVFLSGVWTLYTDGYTNPATSYLPPYDGWMHNGTNVDVTVEWFSGQDNIAPSRSWSAVSNTTTYVAELTWDATNKVFKVTETAQ